MNTATQIVSGRVLVCSLIAIHRHSYNAGKIKKRYGSLGDIIRIKMSRSNNSMGIALAGHRNRSEMGCFIAGINPKGAANSHDFRVGDEILEVKTAN